jgi:hypothetical protein
MNRLKLLAVGCLTFGNLVSLIAIPASAQAQLRAEPNSVQPAEEDSPEQVHHQKLPPGFSEPLEVDQRQSNQFFAPVQRQQIVERQPGQYGSSIDDNNLIGPPPGSQTSDQITPGRQLTIPIR